MRTTTKIIFAILAGCLATILILITYVTNRYTKTESIYKEVILSGATRTEDLGNPVHIKFIKEKDNKHFIDHQIVVTQGDKNLLSLPEDLLPYLEKKISGDTLTILYKMENESELGSAKEAITLKSEPVYLEINNQVKAVSARTAYFKLSVHDMRTDSLKLDVWNRLEMSSCNIRNFELDSRQKVNWTINQSEIEVARLSMDSFTDKGTWKNNQSRVKKLILTGRGKHSLPFDPQVEEIVWEPQNKNASLNVIMKEAGTMSFKQ